MKKMIKKWRFYLPFLLLSTAVLPIWWVKLGITGIENFLLLFVGIMLGWFGFRFYCDRFSPDVSDIFVSAFFQVIFLIFSFWLVISTASFLASGLVLGVNFYLTQKLLEDYFKDKAVLRERLFSGKTDLSLSVYVGGACLSLAAIYVLVLL